MWTLRDIEETEVTEVDPMSTDDPLSNSDSFTDPD